MAHAGRIITCAGPDAPHAFDLVPLCPRNGTLDAPCPICRGHGQWNAEIDLVSFRCKRAICDHCHGAGWIETGTDPVALPDIVLTPEGYPKWITRYVVRSEADTSAGPGARLPRDEGRAVALHFVGFRGDEYHRAVRVFGPPDFIHIGWDRWARMEVVPGDVAVFARGSDADEASAHAFPDLREE